MALLAGRLAAAPLGGADNPAISANLSAYAVDYWPPHASAVSGQVGGALTRHLPVAMAPRNLAGSRAGAYSDDYYHRIHVSLARIDAGNVTSEQLYNVVLWNAYLTPQAFTGVTAPEGITVDPSAGRTFAALEESVHQVTIEREGPAVIEGEVLFAFDGPVVLPIPLSGSRVLPWCWLPDWSSSVVERLEWKTDVLPLADGAEQRIDLRQGARWVYEFAAAAEGTDRRYLEAALYAGGADVWALPLWHDTVHLAAPLAAGAVAIPCDTALRDFRAGGSALLLGDDARTREQVLIQSVTSTHLLLAGATTLDWPAGARVIPTRPAQLTDQVRLSRFTGNALSPRRFRFEILEPWDGTPAAPVLYRGAPVLTMKPNWDRPMDLELARELEQLDALVGGWTSEDRTGLPVAAQTHGWTLLDRQAIADYKALLALLRGRVTALWVPTFADDLTFTSAIAAGGTSVNVAWCGYALHLAGRVGRRDIRVELADGTVAYGRITGATELSGTTEQLTLEAGLGVDVDPDDVVSVSFMALARQQADAAELAYWTADVAEASTTWRTFRHDL